jgi:hypothetical protein
MIRKSTVLLVKELMRCTAVPRFSFCHITIPKLAKAFEQIDK